MAVILDPERVRPYVSLLNRSTASLHREDLDPDRSHPEVVAFALARSEWMVRDGHVGLAAVRSAAWWLASDPTARRAFAAAARSSRSPEAPTWQFIAGALPWLETLHHRTLRPPAPRRSVRVLRPTRVLVPLRLAPGLSALAETAGRLAAERVARFRAAHRPDAASAAGAARLVASLLAERPPVRIAAGERILYDPEGGADPAALEARLGSAPAEALAGLEAELGAIARVTRAFRARFGDGGGPGELPGLERGGYTWLDPRGPILVVDLDEPGIDRLGGPPLPFALPMAAARAAHEWGHLAAHRGAVAPDPDAARSAQAALGQALVGLVRCAPPRLRPPGDPARLGTALMHRLLARLPDLRANLVAARLLAPEEAEVYLWHNLRPRPDPVDPPDLWRRLLLDLHEMQYLVIGAFGVAVPDPVGLYLDVTGSREALVHTGLVSEAALREVAGVLADRYRLERLRWDDPAA